MRYLRTLRVSKRVMNSLCKKNISEVLYDAALELRNQLDITANMQDVVVKFNNEGIIEYITPSCKKITGYDSYQLTGRSFLDFVHSDDLENSIVSYASFVNSDEPCKVCYRYRHASGKVIWLESLKEKIYKDNRNIGAVVVVRDVTERIEAEQAAKALEVNYQAIFNSVNDGIIIYDVETWNIIDVNEKTCTLFGCLRDEMLRKKWVILGLEKFHTRKKSRGLGFRGRFKVRQFDMIGKLRMHKVNTLILKLVLKKSN